MKRAVFEDVIADTPRFVPVFRITRVPEWLKYGYTEPLAKIGAEVYYVDVARGVQFWEIGLGRRYVGTLDIRASYLTFVEYRKVEEDG